MQLSQVLTIGEDKKKRFQKFLIDLFVSSVFFSFFLLQLNLNKSIRRVQIMLL